MRIAILSAVVATLLAASGAQAQDEDTFVALDRSNPREAARSFILACRAGEYDEAAQVLDLRDVPQAERAERGPLLARQLKAVLDQEIWVEFDTVSDDPNAERESLGTIRADTVPVAIELVPVRYAGERQWRFSRSTVAAIPALHETHGATWIEELLPDFLERRVWEMELWQWLGLVVVFLLAWLGGAVLASVGLRLGTRVTRKTEVDWDDDLIDSMRGPLRFLIGVFLSFLLMELLALAAPAHAVIDPILLVLLVGALAWSAIRAVAFASRRIEARAEHQLESGEITELSLRGLRTQVVVLRRVVSILIGVIAVALMLVQFEVVRTVGMSLLASAGIAGVVLGLAAQRSIATLLAGLQLSITQPIRIGATVIVEGEWGTIEEINLTYVVVKVWDERRLIVPMSRFLEQPFQNWTKVSPELIGTVFFHADYRVPIDALREELDRILEDNPLFDGRAKSVLITDATDRTVQVRAMVSAKDASDQWNLRCEVRERMIRFLQTFEGGRYLPRLRLEDVDEPA